MYECDMVRGGGVGGGGVGGGLSSCYIECNPSLFVLK